ncbi:serine hydrolase domain-containing protein [Agromyces kandeliae]|uniref:Serine hydrolase n=1 Tax=Agromyces kandeliae TaxID=2666141 RepID=A0A6L5R1S9_9MICO|nr:serine hydrolase domain-containing protein [Agromyces kandeliae]MRX43408.1 serine hydrolase [Agromyces kandeliae]
MRPAESFATRLDRHLARATRRRGELGPPQVAVRAPALGIDYRFGDADARFHVASVGKLATATLVAQLVEQRAFAFDTPAADLLPGDEVAGLFETTSMTDAAGGATVDHLLSHTAGVADYFDGPVTSGPRMRDLVVSEPDRLWTPADLLAVSRDRQRPVGRPGERFQYSDTGFVLLGRIVEETTGRAFHEVLHERIFAPAGMRDSALLFHSAPDRDRAAVISDGGTPIGAGAGAGAGAEIPPSATRPEIAPLRIGSVEASGFTSLSCDWAGGGIVSTPGDLLAFSRALHGGELLAPETLAHLAAPRNRFRPGIRYGAGMMQVRFGGFSPFLAGLPRPTGHIGVLATHVFHDPVDDADIVLNFASTREMRRSFMTLIEIERALQQAARR